MQPAHKENETLYGGARGLFHLSVIAAALGYFVDVYDLILFSVVRVASLKDLGLSGDALASQGLLLLNMQMAGMLLGGVLWGILGDKKGRLTILFGSILLYSTANFLNGFVTNVEQYAVLRFLAGVGLAGELGGGITLVSEMLTKHSRGYGTMLIASFGVAGGVVAAFVADFFNWRVSFMVGGGIGFALLLLRLGLHESGMFAHVQHDTHSRKGAFFALFTHKRLFFKYSKAILIGIPSWFIAGILITLSPEFAQAKGVAGVVSAGKAVMFFYIGLVVGDFVSGFLSQTFRSRRKILFAFMTMTATMIAIYLTARNESVEMFYAICLGLGFAMGYWAVFVTSAAEQFGTNIRATVATTVPNFARGATVPITLAFEATRVSLGLIWAAAVIGAVCIAVAFYAIARSEETYGKDLDYVEKL